MKITLTELKQFIKSIIKEEVESKKMNELFGFGKREKTPDEDDIKSIAEDINAMLKKGNFYAKEFKELLKKRLKKYFGAKTESLLDDNVKSSSRGTYIKICSKILGEVSYEYTDENSPLGFRGEVLKSVKTETYEENTIPALKCLIEKGKNL